MGTAKLTNALRALALALALLLGITGAVGTPALGPTTAHAQEADTPDTDDDDGFDDWGLLGLLGLLGLAGLRKQPERRVVTDDPARRTR
jgi:MYXO-CTERM domain-containing protein